MPQRDDLIEAMKWTDLLLEWVVTHGEAAEAERLRAKLRSLASMGDASVAEAGMCECKPVWNGAN